MQYSRSISHLLSTFISLLLGFITKLNDYVLLISIINQLISNQFHIEVFGNFMNVGDQRDFDVLIPKITFVLFHHVNLLMYSTRQCWWDRLCSRGLNVKTKNVLKRLIYELI